MKYETHQIYEVELSPGVFAKVPICSKCDAVLGEDEKGNTAPCHVCATRNHQGTKGTKYARSITAECPWCKFTHKARLTPKGRILYFCPSSISTIRAINPAKEAK